MKVIQDVHLDAIRPTNSQTKPIWLLPKSQKGGDDDDDDDVGNGWLTGCWSKVVVVVLAALVPPHSCWSL